MSDLFDAYERLRLHPAFAGSHVSLDSNRQGEALNIAPDWIETAGLAFALDVARELELEIVLESKGLRLAPYSDEFSQRVQGVKRRIAADAVDDDE